MMEVVQTHVLPSVESMDPDVLQAISSLGCFKQRDKLIQDLLSPSHNTEKVIYFLLLERKRRRPAYEDDTDSLLRSRGIIGDTTQQDPPRKRIDTCRVNGTSGSHFGQISEGSPLTPRRQHFKYAPGGLANAGLTFSGFSSGRHHARRSPSTGSHSSLQIHSPTRGSGASSPLHYNSNPSTTLGNNNNNHHHSNTTHLSRRQSNSKFHLWNGHLHRRVVFGRGGWGVRVDLKHFPVPDQVLCS